MSRVMSQGETATNRQYAAERSVTTSPDALSVLSPGRNHIFGTACHSLPQLSDITSTNGGQEVETAVRRLSTRQTGDSNHQQRRLKKCTCPSYPTSAYADNLLTNAIRGYRLS